MTSIVQSSATPYRKSHPRVIPADVPTKFRASVGPPVSLQTTAAGCGAAMVQHM